jgi:glycosyltransferase involved in cell wall biosynthesis/predicted N-acetyltransferase YhbS
MDLSIIVAVYNEEEVLHELHRRLSLALQALGRSYEIILVDDGSRDLSLSIMQSLRERDEEHVRVLSFTRNFGHHIALTAGLDCAVGDVIVLMDADLQDQPEEIHKLLDKLDEGYDVVWGERAERQFAWYKNLSSKLFLWLMNSVARAEVPLDSSIFRAMRRPVADDLRLLREKARYLPGLVRWLGYRQTSVPVEHGKRFAGQTKYSFWRLIKLALSTATSFSSAPLQLATVSGMTAAGAAALFVLYIFVRKLTGAYTVPGYASVMIAIFAFGALQLIVIGLMGEYISRIYGEAQGRPLYLLRDLGATHHPTLRPSDRPRPSLRQTSSLNDGDLSSLLALIANDTHLPFANVFSSSEPLSLAKYHFDKWASANPCYYTHSEQGRLVGVALIHELEWDSSILGKRSARIDYINSFPAHIDDARIETIHQLLGQIKQFANDKHIHLIDARVSNQDLFLMRAFEAAGFHTVDVLATLGANKNKIDQILARTEFQHEGDRRKFSEDLLVRPMREEDIPVLSQLSYDAFGDPTMIQDRFFLEPSIPHTKAQALFREWFLNLAKHHQEGRGQVLVAEMNGQTVGYIGLEPLLPYQKEQWWSDALNAVAPAARGQGVYRALVISALDYVRNAGGDGLITKTQSSTYRVINTWLHLGCNLYESFATLHWTRD